MDLFTAQKASKKWWTSISDIEVGHEVEHARKGKGIVTVKTQRTVTVTYANGDKVKNTYNSKDAEFWVSDF